MRRRQPGKSPLPSHWLISDARNDAVLDGAIARLPRGAGLIFRHYHLAEPERRARFDRLAALVRRRGGLIVLAGDARTARRWRADGFYGAPGGGAAGGLVRLVTVHDRKQLVRANLESAVSRRTAVRAELMLISPVFATRSHPGGKTLGVVRFAALARWSQVPVIALGGMTCARARHMAAMIDGWAAIDGLSG